MKIQGVSDEELAGLTDAEREALEEGQEQEEGEAKDLKTIAEGNDDDPKPKPGPDDDDDDQSDEAKAEREKAEAAAKDEKAEHARVEAEAKAKREAELKAMSAEERAAAEAADKSATEAAAKVEAEAKAKAEAEAKAKAEVADADDADEVVRPRVPRYEVKPVEKYAEQIKALDDQYDAAVVKFDAGDIELKALLATQREVDAKRAELREANLRATLAAEYNENAVKSEWLGDVHDFFTSVKAKDGIDYSKPGLNAAFDTTLKALAADEANAKHSPRWFLREADKLVRAEIGFVAKEPSASGEAATVNGKPAGRKPALAVVRDVGGLPSAGDDDASGGNPEFSALDKLDGIDYEDALAAMPKSKQDLYLRHRA